MNKSGFTLIELILAMVLATFIIISLSRALSMSAKYSNSARQVVTLNKKILILTNQIEKDICAAFIAPEEEKRDKKQEEEPAFYGTALKENLFKSLTFLTNSSLVEYGKIPKYPVVVTYSLKLSKSSEPQAYKLFREEKDTNKKILSNYEVASNIKTMSIEYFKLKKSTKDKPDEQDQGFFEWGIQGDTKDKLPKYVKVNISFWDDTFKTSTEIHFTVPIVSIKPKPVQPQLSVQPKTQEREPTQEEEQVLELLKGLTQ